MTVVQARLSAPLSRLQSVGDFPLQCDEAPPPSPYNASVLKQRPAVAASCVP